MRGLPAVLCLSLAALLLPGCSDSGDGGDGGDDGNGGTGLGGGASGGGASASGSVSATQTGSGSNGTGGAGSAPVELSVAAVNAYPVNPAFDPSALSVPANALVQVTFANEDLVPVVQHNWVVDGIPGASSDTIGPGTETTFTFTAPATPGEFTFYCAVGDHRDRGMEGTLTVTS